MLTLLLLLPELPPLLRSTIAAVAATATRCQCTGTAVITVAAAAAQSPSSFVAVVRYLSGMSNTDRAVLVARSVACSVACSVVRSIARPGTLVGLFRKGHGHNK